MSWARAVMAARKSNKSDESSEPDELVSAVVAQVAMAEGAPKRRPMPPTTPPSLMLMQGINQRAQPAPPPSEMHAQSFRPRPPSAPPIKMHMKSLLPVCKVMPSKRVIRPATDTELVSVDVVVIDPPNAPPPDAHDEVPAATDKHAAAIGRKVKKKMNINKFIATGDTTTIHKISKTAEALQLLDSEHTREKGPLAPPSKAKARATMKRKRTAALAADYEVDAAAYGVMMHPEPNVKEYAADEHSRAVDKRTSANDSDGPADHMYPNEDKEHADVFMGVHARSSRIVPSCAIPAWPAADDYAWPSDDETVWPDDDETTWPDDDETTLPEATETTLPEATETELPKRSRGTKTWVGGGT